DKCIVEHHCGMKYSGKRRHGAANLLNELLDRGRVGDIKRLGLDVCTARRETGERLPRLGARRATPPGKDEMARAALGKPARRRETEAAATPSDEMRLVS